MSPKLTPKQREEIKKSDKPNADLAKEYGVSAAAISKLKKVKAVVNVTKMRLTDNENEVIITIPKSSLIKPMLNSVLAELTRLV